MSRQTGQTATGQTIREKAIQDREVVRVKMADVEKALMDLRQQDRDLTQFLRTLDRYDPQPELRPDARSVSINSVDFRNSLKRHRHIGDGLLPLRDPQPVSGPIVNRPSAYGGGGRHITVSDEDAIEQYLSTLLMTSLPESPTVSEAALNADFVVRPTDGPSVVAEAKRYDLPREGSNQRKVTDIAHLYLDLMDHYATTSQLVEFMRNEASVYPLLGARQSQTLSSYLSRDPRFAFERGKGWTLAKDAESAPADQGGSDADSAKQEGGVE
jgi:hypothetical protein